MKKIMNFLTGILTACLLWTLTSCGSTPETDICVSIPPQAYLVKRIAGEETMLTVMIPPGSAPPTYSPNAAQMRELHQSRLYIKIGHPDFLFEKKHIDPFLNKHPGVMVVDMADSVDIIPGDVHIWLSPAIMRINAERVYRKLAQLNPGKQEMYLNNFRDLRQDIDSLDAKLRRMFEPHQGKAFMVLHPALEYFCRDYGLKQVSIRKDNKAPSAKKIAELIEYARDKNIGAILIQKEFSSEQLDVFSRETGAEVIVIDPLNTSWLENLYETATILERVFNEQ